jgi:two-component system nitrate/nitrite response regulator NarL
VEHIFLAKQGKLTRQWQAAFPAAIALQTLAAVQALPKNTARLIWLDISGFDDYPVLVRQAIALGAPVVIMTAMPNDNQAYTVLSIGAYGYCHSLATSKQLLEIATVIVGGGLWVGQGVMRRLLDLTNANKGETTGEMPAGVSSLTSKELSVAQYVAAGLNNREIAEKMHVVERTVKAHLTVVFETLGVRDRVQLALVMNKISIQ